ncbi:MAG: chemotaxis protein CheB [Candidatus Dormibacteria bacterium]
MVEGADQAGSLARLSRGLARAGRLVVMAASAGGVHAIGEVLAGLPGDLPAAVAVVQHLPPHHRSRMAQIMTRHTSLLVKQARDAEAVRTGVVYMAPPDRHLLINRDATFTLAETELVNFVRPSADLLFDSAAATYGDMLVAVVLSGTGEDGTMGIRAVKKREGMVIVQEADTAEFSGMPHAAIATGLADMVLPLEDIGPAVNAAVRREHP